MKESDALTKWCPHIRFNGCNTDPQTSVQETVAPFYTCIGSKCMMWESYQKIERKVSDKPYRLKSNDDAHQYVDDGWSLLKVSEIAPRSPNSGNEFLANIHMLRYVYSGEGTCGLITKGVEE